MFDAGSVGCVNMTLVNSSMLKMDVKGSFRHLPNRKMKAQKSQPPGFPVAGKWVPKQIDRISEIASLVRRSVRRSCLSTDLHTAATGHAHTRGEGIILSYAPNKQHEPAT